MHEQSISSKHTEKHTQPTDRKKKVGFLSSQEKKNISM